MKKKIFIVALCIIFIVSLVVYKKDKSEFTQKEYNIITDHTSEFFENQGFNCKNEWNESDYDEWANKFAVKDVEYVEPVVCRKISENKIKGVVYKSEIIYYLVTYEDMIYNKNKSKKPEITMSVINTVIPEEELLSHETIFSFYQEIRNEILYLNLYINEGKINELDYDRYMFLMLPSMQSDDENYKYYQDIFELGLPQNAEITTKNPEEVSDYFDLLVEKGYAENLLNEFKVNKEEADEIAHRFEKSKIYDKIYNLKY